MTLSPTAEAIYSWALVRGAVPLADRPALAAELGATPEEVSREIGALVELRLLTPAADAPDSLVPSSPDIAAAELVSPLRIEARKLERRTSDLEAQLSALGPLYLRSRQARVPRQEIDVVDGEDRVRAVLRDVVAGCSTEIISAHPGVCAIDSRVVLDPDLLPRDVVARFLFQHPVRVNSALRSLLGDLVDAGHEIRTCEEIAGHVVVADRGTAVISHHRGTPGAVVLREPRTVDHLYRGLEQDWATALPFETEGTVAPRYGIAAEEIKRAILRLLAAGAKDEQIARRLSISVRTCRRHIAEIMAELEVTSRFQAGVEAARAGMLAHSTAAEV